MGPKEILIQTKLVPKKDVRCGEKLYPNKCCVQFLLVETKLAGQKMFVQNNLWFQKNIGFKKNLVRLNFLG